jgi:hypothetical protein
MGVRLKKLTLSFPEKRLSHMLRKFYLTAHRIISLRTEYYICWESLKPQAGETFVLFTKNCLIIAWKCTESFKRGRKKNTRR